MSSPTATAPRHPDLLPMIGTAVLARLPLAALSIAVLVHVQRVTGSFAVAGAASGALSLAQGVGGPLLGRVVDGHGQTRTLVASSLVASGALAAFAVLPGGSPAVLHLLLAAVLGAATPPVGACLRALLAVVVPPGAQLRRAYVLDAASTELTWVSAPPMVLLAATLRDSATALLAAAAVLVAATMTFAALPVSRRWRPAPPPSSRRSRRASGGALRSAALRTLVVVLVGVGVLFGATEVAITAVADALGCPAAAGPLLGLWGVGSFAGGLVATRCGCVRTATGLAMLLAALAAGHLALVPAMGGLVTLGAVVTLAGGLIAPILAGAYAMVDDAAPAGTVTEAFAWVATASAAGSSAGAAVAGAVVAISPAAGFVVAAGAAALAALIAMARRDTLSGTLTPEPATAVLAAA